jgi:hypothetical protein
MVAPRKMSETTPEANKAFEQTKQDLVEATILTFPDVSCELSIALPFCNSSTSKTVDRSLDGP